LNMAHPLVSRCGSLPGSHEATAIIALPNWFVVSYFIFQFDLSEIYCNLD
jgi:hypothetical protein